MSGKAGRLPVASTRIPRSDCRSSNTAGLSSPPTRALLPSGVMPSGAERTPRFRSQGRGELSGAAKIGLDTSASVGLRHTRGRPPRGPRPAFVLRRNSTAAPPRDAVCAELGLGPAWWRHRRRGQRLRRPIRSFRDCRRRCQDPRRETEPGAARLGPGSETPRTRQLGQPRRRRRLPGARVIKVRARRWALARLASGPVAPVASPGATTSMLEARPRCAGSSLNGATSVV